MEKEIYVYVDYQGGSHLVGRLWTHARRQKESVSFEYDRQWLKIPHRFSLEPALMLVPGVQHTAEGKTIFGALGDSAPDRWGRVLMRRAERRRAKAAQETPRSLLEIDYLLGVNDEARMGAIRFTDKQNGPFLAESHQQPIPPLINLAKLLSASEHVMADKDTDEDLRLLLAPGSSLGGSHPKASVRDADGQLLIAKFPYEDDDFSTVHWEALLLGLAKKSGIPVADWRLEMINNKAVLLVKRFDRIGKKRIPFLSAMSMLDMHDNQQASYMEIADALKQYGGSPENDMQQLWRRMVFNILTTNTDDHLRNHGFLYIEGQGWRLSPAYDLNPVPLDIKPRVLSLNIDLDDNTGSVELALSVAAYFNLTQPQALDIIAEIKQGVAQWRTQAKQLGISKVEIERMESAFDLI